MIIKELYRKLKVEAGKYLYSTLKPSLSIKVNNVITVIKSVVTLSVLVFECVKKDGMLSVTSQRTWE